MEEIKERVKAMQALKNPAQTLEQVFKEELAHDNFPKSPVPNIKTNNAVYILIEKNN